MPSYPGLSLVAAALCIAAVPAFATESLRSQASLIAALEAGRAVAVSVDLSRCTAEAVPHPARAAAVCASVRTG